LQCANASTLHYQDPGKTKAILLGMPFNNPVAYAMVDQKEFFGEMSVTYLSNGYHQLEKANKKIMED
jgi:hypothetical protein